MGREGARRRTAAALTCALVLTTACKPEERHLATAPYLALGGYPAETLHLDRAGRIWAGAVGEMSRLPLPGSGQTQRIRLRIGGQTAPAVVAEGHGTLYLRAEDHLYALRMESMNPTAQREGFGDVPVLLDVRGRFVAQGAGSGAVLAFDPQTLDPEWGWAARGAPTSAVAATAEGDLVWQALAPSVSGAVLLQRDLQTGRILGEHEIPDRIVSLATTRGGDLLAVTASGDRLHALRLQPRGQELTTVWRIALGTGGEGRPEVRYGPGARLAALFLTGSEHGLRVLDAEAGHLVGLVEETPLDAAFSADGLLYVLTPDDVRRVVLPDRARSQ